MANPELSGGGRGVIVGLGALACIWIAACKSPACPQCPQCPPAGTNVVYAGAGAKCADDKIHVTTGTNEGKCSYGQGADGKVETLNCDDGKGNSGSMTCKDGVLLCSSTGAGKCEFAGSK
jgi:hypothetical protein